MDTPSPSHTVSPSKPTRSHNSLFEANLPSAQPKIIAADNTYAPSKKALFNIQNLHVQSGRKLLLNVDNLTLYKSSFTTFIGPNGAGKSTLLHSLLNQHSVTGLTTTGTIDSTIGQLNQLVSQGKIAWVGQHERYELPLSALQYALLGASPQLTWYQSPGHSHVLKANQLLMDFELYDLKDTRVQYLSGGEKQRLSIVRALMQETTILMLDEPTNHLDIRHQRFLLAYLQDLVRQQLKTVIVVLHDLTHAYRYSDEVILMNQGAIVAQGAPNVVMTQAKLNPVYQVAIESYDTAGGRVFI